VQGRKKSLLARYLDLVYLGYVCNILSALWVTVLGAFVCFPPSLPVAVGTINYTSVILLVYLELLSPFGSGLGRASMDGRLIGRFE
jgi:choline transport protein